MKSFKQHQTMQKIKAFVKYLNSKQASFDDIMEYIDVHMEREGFKFVGSGAYALIYSHPVKKQVIKIFEKDKAYMHWFKFCLKNQKNPFTPKIFGRITRIPKTNFFWCRLEKLEDHSQDIYYHDMIQVLKKGKNVSPTNRFIGNQDLLDITKFISDFNFIKDLHRDNIMIRGKQLVVIDPIQNK